MDVYERVTLNQLKSRHRIQVGQVLERRNFKIPIGLLRQYDPDLDFVSANLGISVTVLKLEPIEDPSPAATTACAGWPQAAVAP